MQKNQLAALKAQVMHDFPGVMEKRAKMLGLIAELERLQSIDPGILEQLENGTQAGPGWAPDEIDPDDLIGWAQ